LTTELAEVQIPRARGGLRWSWLAAAVVNGKDDQRFDDADHVRSAPDSLSMGDGRGKMGEVK
jgi:hypothetical protein